MPGDVIILAADPQVSMYLDCETLDLILVDGDANNDLGGVTSGGGINNDPDRFWANMIVYMDELEGPPIIARNGSELSVGDYVAIQWLLNGVPIDGATSSTYTTTENGNYTATVELTCGCVKTSSEVSIGLTGTAADPSVVTSFTLYPNPVSDVLTLNFALEESIRIGIEIYDPMGRLAITVVADEYFDGKDHSINVPLSDLPAGVYYMTLQTPTGNSVRKFIRASNGN